VLLRTRERELQGHCLSSVRLGRGAFDLVTCEAFVTIGFPSRATARRPGSSLTIQW